MRLTPDDINKDDVIVIIGFKPTTVTPSSDGSLTLSPISNTFPPQLIGRPLRVLSSSLPFISVTLANRGGPREVFPVDVRQVDFSKPSPSYLESFGPLRTPSPPNQQVPPTPSRSDDPYF